MPPAWDEIRNDFPALETYVHLNAAACSPTPRPVRQAMSAYYRELEEDGDVHWSEWIERREEIRALAARLVHAAPEEIGFVANTSTGMNLVVDLLAGNGPVITDELEFPAVTLPWIHRGVPVSFVPAIEGLIRIESFSPAYAPRAATIVLSHVQYSNGCRQDLDAFGAIKEDRSFVVCGSQSAGAFPIDVKASQVDAFVTTGQKWLCGGYGSGFAYFSKPLLEKYPPRQVGWLSVENPFAFDNRSYRLLSGAQRVELGCPAFAGIFALGAALDYILDIGVEAISERVLALNRLLTEQLTAAGFEVLSPGDPHRSGETLCQVPEPKRARAFLQSRGIIVTQKPEGVRISTHFYNNERDLDACVSGLKDYLKTLSAS